MLTLNRLKTNVFNICTPVLTFFQRIQFQVGITGQHLLVGSCGGTVCKVTWRCDHFAGPKPLILLQIFVICLNPVSAEGYYPKASDCESQDLKVNH